MSVDIQTNKTVLTLLAHPDDAEILAGGTLLRLAKMGWQIHIATATPGDCGSATLGPDEIAAIRRKEGAAAAAKVGGTYHCLEMRDLTVAFDELSIRKVIDLLRDVNPSIVIAHPRCDYMIDHEQMHLLARTACFSFGIPNASKKPVPKDAAVPYLYYADPIEGLDPYTGKLVSPTTSIDVSDVIDAKTDMLACHVSQREWLRAHHGMDEYLDAVRRHGQTRGQQIGVKFAESFIQHRGHAFPHDDVLAKLLQGKAHDRA